MGFARDGICCCCCITGLPSDATWVKDTWNCNWTWVKDLGRYDRQVMFGLPHLLSMRSGPELDVLKPALNSFIFRLFMRG
jgi:hypothetical protein